MGGFGNGPQRAALFWLLLAGCFWPQLPMKERNSMHRSPCVESMKNFRLVVCTKRSASNDEEEATSWIMSWQPRITFSLASLQFCECNKWHSSCSGSKRRQSPMIEQIWIFAHSRNFSNNLLGNWQCESHVHKIFRVIGQLAFSVNYSVKV